MDDARMEELMAEVHLKVQEVYGERVRQEEKWGEQNYPLAGTISSRFAEKFAEREQKCKAACEKAAWVGELDWLLILAEEVEEFSSAATRGDLGLARAELVQVAAVALAAIASYDRNGR